MKYPAFFAHFSWSELLRSGEAERLALPNEPDKRARQRLVELVFAVLDPLRSVLERPVFVTSGFRSPEVNKAVKGSSTSQHMLGEAADIKAQGLCARELLTALVRSGLPFDQAIGYDQERGGHVHVSYTIRRPNRGEVLWAPAAGGYRPWSPSETTASSEKPSSSSDSPR
jgi:hypothetical protein